MSRGRISAEIRKEIISNVRGGMSVREAAERYGVSTKSIYSWLGKGAKGQRSDILEASRLRRENEALYRMLGRLTFKLNAGEKN